MICRKNGVFTQVVHYCAVGQEERVKHVGNCKDHVEIRDREQVLFALLNTCFALCILALGTMTVATAIVAYTDVSAGVAPVHMTAQGGGAAATDGAQGSENIPVGLVPFRKLAAKPFNDLSQLKSRLQPAL